MRYRYILLLLCGLHAATIAEEADPYLWLEEVDGEKALQWVEEQSAKGTAALEAVEDRVVVAADPDARAPFYVTDRSEAGGYLSPPVSFRFVPVEIVAEGRMEAAVRPVAVGAWVVSLGQNLLGGEGKAFEVAQRRLGGGRIHHAMRTIAQCKLAFDMMCERALSRESHGSIIAEHQMVQEKIADSYAQIQMLRRTRPRNLDDLSTALQEFLGRDEARKVIEKAKADAEVSMGREVEQITIALISAGLVGVVMATMILVRLLVVRNRMLEPVPSRVPS